VGRPRLPWRASGLGQIGPHSAAPKQYCPSSSTVARHLLTMCRAGHCESGRAWRGRVGRARQHFVHARAPAPAVADAAACAMIFTYALLAPQSGSASQLNPRTAGGADDGPQRQEDRLAHGSLRPSRGLFCSTWGQPSQLSLTERCLDQAIKTSAIAIECSMRSRGGHFMSRAKGQTYAGATDPHRPSIR
jgi:hypothetical protein